MSGPSAPALALLVLLMVVPAGVSFSAPASAPSASGHLVPSVSMAPVAPPLAVPQLFRGLLQHNLSGPSVIPAANPPLSAYPETPAPSLPNTVPTVVSVVTNGRGCCYYVNLTPAGGPWDAVVLNYTGTASGQLYDSSYQALVGGVQVLFGTTPEYGTWTVLDNITQYESLLEPGANFTFILRAALSGGYFTTSVTLSFYPPPAGAPVPSEPSRVVPIWSKQFIKPTTPTVSASATVPANASAATLELWAFGFQSDEFWWSTPRPARALSLAVDGTPFETVFPFPYLQTGAMNPFLWRPIPGPYTLSVRPYDTNVTGALGLLAGAHAYNASVLGRDPGSDWLVEGALLLWTDRNVTSASSTGGSSSVSGPFASGATSSMSTSYTWSSDLSTTAGSRHVTSAGSGTFSETALGVAARTNGTGWNNTTQISTMVDRTTASEPNRTTWANATRSFQLGVHFGSRFVVTSTTGGSYPVTGNFTISMLDVQLQWTGQSGVRSVGAAGPWLSVRSTVDNELSGGTGVWGGSETLTSPIAVPTNQLTNFVQSVSPKYTAESASGPFGTSSYSHVLVGSDFQPTDPNGAETILENRFDTAPAPLAAVVAASPDPLDVGGALALTADVHGGAGVYTYQWSGLPGGCASANRSTIACGPNGSGTFSVALVVTDTLGDVVAAPTLVLVVAPALLPTVTTPNRGADVGGPLVFSATVGGGVPPFSCTWSVTGLAPTTQGCSLPVDAPTTVAGPVSASVSVSDATGANVTSVPLTVGVNGDLVVTLQPVDPNATVRVGAPAQFSVSVAGGTAPVTVAWFVDGAEIPGLNGTTATFVPNATGPMTVAARVVDQAGGTAEPTPVTVTVQAALNGTGPTSGAGASSGLDATFWLAVGLAAVAVVEAVLLLGMRRPPPRTSR
jgi:hypothetical protein